MKAFLIDPVFKNITETEVDGDDYKAICKRIRCNMLTLVGLNDKRDVVFVNDEGLIDGTVQEYGMFVVTGSLRSVPLAGYGLVLGTTPYGDSDDVKMTLEELRAMVTFPNAVEIAERARKGDFD